MLVYTIGDVVVIFMFCVALGLIILGLLYYCVIQFFDWIRRKRK